MYQSMSSDQGHVHIIILERPEELGHMLKAWMGCILVLFKVACNSRTSKKYIFLATYLFIFKHNNKSFSIFSFQFKHAMGTFLCNTK